jgi:hypothetical protein
MENMSIAPIVLDVPGDTFKATHKYGCSVAMVLDDSAASDEQTGDVEAPGGHVMVFYEINIEQAYSIVLEFIGFQQDVSLNTSWAEAKQMIDILVEGKNWIILTNSNGFVFAVPYPEKPAAELVFEAAQESYNEWAGDE